MFRRKNNKQGLTLIEMLVVIAIIAILVSVAIPTFSKANDKSAAATNAANLRAIEGKVSILKTTYPEVFEEFIDAAGTMDDFADSGLGSLINGWLGGGQLESGKFNIVTAEDGVITIRPSATETNSYEITNVPTSKAVTVGTDYVEEGLEMSVLIEDNNITAYYGRYSSVDFADIAEDGEYNGSNNPVECPCEDGKASWDGSCSKCNHPISEHDVTYSGPFGMIPSYGACNHVD